MKQKSSIELKREYWSMPDKYFTPKMVDAVVEKYGEKPATSGEAFFQINYNLRYILWTVKNELKKLIKERKIN